MKTAVIILNWNGCEMLRRFLPSVVKYSSVKNVEVYVADNGSTDQSIEMLRAEFPTVKLILLSENHGFAEGYNLAISEVDVDYVVLLNSDVEVTENWITPLSSYLDEHPEVVACQPKIRSYHIRSHFEYAGAAGGFIDCFGYPFCRGRILGEIEKDEAQYDTILPLFWATGAALFIRRESYIQAGGLDKRFFAHMEEIDLCWRLKARGGEIVCIPDSIVYHVGGGTLQKESPRKTFLNFRNNLIMLYKNLPEKELKQVLRVRLYLDYLAAMAFVLKGNYKNALAVVKARREFKKTRSLYYKDRMENLEKNRLHSIPERTKMSILWQFYVKGRKHYSQLFN